jgi:hypothetical protein
MASIMKRRNGYKKFSQAEAPWLEEEETNEEGDESERDTWVQCDACKKWRRILESVAEQLSDEVPW